MRVAYISSSSTNHWVTILDYIHITRRLESCRFPGVVWYMNHGGYLVLFGLLVTILSLGIMFIFVFKFSCLFCLCCCMCSSFLWYKFVLCSSRRQFVWLCLGVVWGLVLPVLVRLVSCSIVVLLRYLFCLPLHESEGCYIYLWSIIFFHFDDSS